MPKPSGLANVCLSLIFVFPVYAQEPPQNPQNPPAATQPPAPTADSRPAVTSKDVVPAPEAAKPVDTPVTSMPSLASTPSVPSVPNAAPILIKLEDGTPVHLILSETISSADAQVGQTIEFEVVDDIVIDGVCVVPYGATAWATVTSAQAKHRMGRAGHLDVNIDKVRLADGEKALLRAVKDSKRWEPYRCHDGRNRSN